MRLTTLGVENIEAVTAFDKFCFPTDCWKTEAWHELLSDPRAIYYAFLEDGQIVADVFIYNWQGEKDYVKIMNLAVHPAYRNQGLAHKLLEHVTTEMGKQEMRRFCGETRSTNYAMQNVFTGCGYKLSTIEEAYYDDPTESAYKYVLQL